MKIRKRIRHLFGTKVSPNRLPNTCKKRNHTFTRERVYSNQTQHVIKFNITNSRSNLYASWFKAKLSSQLHPSFKHLKCWTESKLQEIQHHEEEITWIQYMRQLGYICKKSIGYFFRFIHFIDHSKGPGFHEFSLFLFCTVSISLISTLFITSSFHSL